MKLNTMGNDCRQKIIILGLYGFSMCNKIRGVDLGSITVLIIGELPLDFFLLLVWLCYRYRFMVIPVIIRQLHAKIWSDNIRSNYIYTPL